MKKKLPLSKYIKPLDYLVLALSLAITSFFAFGFSSFEEGSLVVIKNSTDSWLYSLDEPRMVQIHGAIGVTTIIIENGEVLFVDSPCTNKTCVASPAISHSHQWSACLPNQVFAYIQGKEGALEEFDVLSN